MDATLALAGQNANQLKTHQRVAERSSQNYDNSSADMNLADAVNEASDPDPSELQLPQTNMPAWLGRVIESVAFGMVVLDRRRRVLLCNLCAREALAKCGQILEVGKVVPWVTTAQGDRIQRALIQSTEGWRRMLLLQGDESKTIISLSPILLDDGQTGILLTTEKQSVCSPQTIACYANLFGLTASEANVLGQLALGHSPNDAAVTLNISVATVRSHIKSVLLKTDAECVRSLLVKVAKLPPMVGSFS